MNLFKKGGLVLLLLMAFFNLGFSGEIKEKASEDGEQEFYRVKEVKEVVVTATMTPQDLKDIATTVNVVTKKDIDTTASGSALNILTHTPGIFVNRSGDFGRADVDIRGLGQNCRRVAVLVDGKPEKMGLFGCAVSHAFPLDNVQRIEVVKGPASVLYGGEAMGGAVNIITHSPEKKWETDLTAFYGSYNTQQYNLKHGANLGKFKYYLTYDKRKSDGHIENSQYEGDSVTGKLIFDVTKNTQLTFKAKYFDGLKYEPGTVTTPVTDLWNDYERGAIDLSLKQKWNKNELYVKVYRNFGKHQFSDGWDSRDHTNGAMARFTTKVIANNELTLGGDVRFFGGKSYSWPQGEWDKTEGSVFIQDQYIIHHKWILSAGMRLQLDSLYGPEWCPQFGLVFQASQNTLFRGNIGKGFRSPQLNELYMFPAANEDLEPERVWNYEIGMEHRFSDWLTVKGSLFHMKGSNLIQTVKNSTPPPMYVFANVGEFSFSGFEVEMDAALTRFLSAYVGYSYLDTGDNTRGRAGQKWDAALQLKIKRLTAAFKGQYVTDYYAADNSEERIPSYFLLNGRFIVNITKSVDLLLDINNILDNEYNIYGEFPGLSAGLYRMPGRTVQVGLRFRR